MKFSKKVISATEKAKYPFVKHFVQQYCEYYNSLRSYDKTYSFKFDKELKPSAIEKTDRDPWIVLLENIKGWLGYIIYTTDYKIVQLMKDISNAINNHHYLTVLVLSRTLMENAANVSHYNNELKSQIEKMISLDVRRSKVIKKDFSVRLMEILLEIHNICYLFASRMGFNWMLKAKNYPKTEDEYKRLRQIDKKLEKIPISKFVKEMPKENFFGSLPYNHYSRLCDFVHPNLASNALVIDEVNESSDYQIEYVLSREITNPEVLGMVLQIISVPILGSLKITIESLSNLKENYDYFEKMIYYLDKN